MRKFILVVAAGLFLATAQAQSFQLANVSPDVPSAAYNTSYDFKAEIVNTSGATLRVIANRTNNALATNHSSFYCWGLACYDPSTDASPDTLSIAPGDTNRSFKLTIDPALSAGYDSVTVRFMNASSPFSDYIDHTFRINFDKATARPEAYALGNALQLPYPNPSQGEAVVFPYNLPQTVSAGELRIVNLLGQPVMQQAFQGAQGTLRAETLSLAPGVYTAWLVA